MNHKMYGYPAVSTQVVRKIVALCCVESAAGEDGKRLEAWLWSSYLATCGQVTPST
ncbi:MAG: hypothetical protein HY273_12800 [Gammaproteobacteria bacterium]|nr:hypothetical protein [Gammaproteobacteria bacterium]